MSTVPTFVYVAKNRTNWKISNDLFLLLRPRDTSPQDAQEVKIDDPTAKVQGDQKRLWRVIFLWRT